MSLGFAPGLALGLVAALLVGPAGLPVPLPRLAPPGVVAVPSPSPAPSLAPSGPAPAAPLTQPVYGNVYARPPSGGPDDYLPGPLVVAVSRPCAGPGGCVVVASAKANGSTALWGMALAPGLYFLYSEPFGDWGGAVAPIVVNNSTVGPVPLVVYPWAGYSNATFVLPGWSDLAPFAANCNAALPCPSGNSVRPYGGQVPILSWTQDGAYYVNASFELVYYSFVNRTVRDIAPWLPLFDNVMDYEGIENTEWITVDGSYIYEFGCRTLCTPSSSVSLYAVNVTTGRSFSWNLTGVSRINFARNGQIDLIGEAGNHSIAAVTVANGTVLGYGLWNRTQWVLAKLPFFEANNLYWVPGLESYFNIQAEGATTDWIEQFRLVGPYPGTSLVPVALGSFAHLYPVGGVNGLVVNATDQSLAFTAQGPWMAGITAGLRWGASPTLRMTRLAGNESSFFGQWPDNGAYPNVESSEHRPSYVSDGPAHAGYWNGWFGNGSSFVDPVTGRWAETNVTLDHPQWTGQATHQQHQLSPAALEGLFYNTSYSLVPWAYDCRTNLSSCAIRGNDSLHSAVGTVWWAWKSGLPEFPFPASAPSAQTVGPSAPVGFTARWANGSLLLDWSRPVEGADPLLNYTLFVGLDPSSSTQVLSLAPGRTHLTLPETGAPPRYYLRLEAWNLHFHGAFARTYVDTGSLSGTLDLTVVPSFAQVSLDGQSLALPPNGSARVPVAPGNHTVRAWATGYLSFQGPVTVGDRNVTHLTVSLAPILPVLHAVVSPSYALVVVDGALVTLDPGGTLTLAEPPGNHTLSASAPSYRPFGPLNLTLGLGQTVYESITLLPMLGEIRGAIAPADALLLLDGAPVYAPGGSFEFPVPFGSHRLWAGAVGYAPAEASPLEVTAGGTVWLNLTLEPYPGLWVIETNPSDAVVTVDDGPVSATDAAGGIALGPGIHGLRVEAPGFDPFAAHATIPANTTLVWNVALNRSVGWLELTVSPAAASLFVDQVPYAREGPGPYNLTLPIGEHRLAATADGGGYTSAIVQIAPHRTLEVHLTVPAPAPLTNILWPLGLGAASAAFAVLSVLWYRSLRRKREPRLGARPPSAP